MSATDSDRGRLAPPAISSLSLNVGVANDRSFPRPQLRAARRPWALGLGAISLISVIPLIIMTVPNAFVRDDFTFVLLVTIVLGIGWATCAIRLREWFSLDVPSLRFPEDVAHERDRCAAGRWPIGAFFLGCLAVFVFVTQAGTWFETSGIIALLIVPALRAAMLAWRFPDPADLPDCDESPTRDALGVGTRRALVTIGIAACAALVFVYLFPGVSDASMAMAGSASFMIVCAWAIWLAARPAGGGHIPVSWRSTLPLLSIYAAGAGVVAHRLPSHVMVAVLVLCLVLSLAFDLKRAWQDDAVPAGLFAPE